MKNLAFVAALLLTASPAEAQVTTSNAAEANTANAQQQSAGQAGQSAASQAPTTGVICEELMAATFCNVPSSPNTAGYGSGGATESSVASGAAGSNTSSIPPCGFSDRQRTVQLIAGAVKWRGPRSPCGAIGPQPGAEPAKSMLTQQADTTRIGVIRGSSLSGRR